MPTPSLIIPSAPVYDEGLLYGLNVYGTNFVPEPIPFTRATTATRTNAAGLIELAPYNLAQWSEQFDNVVWTKSATTLTANTTTAPDGTLTADTLIENTANSSHQVFQSVTSVNGATAYTATIYVKQNTNRNVALRVQDGAFTYGQAIVTYNLNTGALISQSVVGNGVIVSTSATLVNGYYRIQLTFTLNLSTSFRTDILIVNGSSNSYLGDGTSNIIIWGAQLVEGTSALPYLKTETRLNRPRVDFSLGGCPNLLLEPQRTNLVLQSSSFDSASWTKLNGSVTANITTSPSGIVDADKIVEDATNNFHGVLQAVTTTSGVTCNVSFYAKASERGYIQWNNQVNTEFANFDLISGVIGTSSGVTNHQIQSVGNGWYRCSLNFVPTVTGTAGQVRIVIVTSASAVRLQNYIGDGTSGLFVWGAQFEAGAYPTTLIPTTAATVTRNADSFTESNVFSRGMITAAGGTLFVDFRNNISLVRDASTNGVFLLDSSSSSFGFRIKTYAPSNRLAISKVISSVETPLYTTLTDTAKIAIKWNGAIADVFVNGVKVVSATTFTSTNMDILGALGSDVPKYIQQMSLYPTPLSDGELISMTTI